MYQAGCDIIFTGHSHYYVQTKALQLDGTSNPPEEPGSGTVMVVTGDGAAPPHDVTSTNEHLRVAEADNIYGYTELTIEGNTLNLRHIQDYGTVVDQATYTPNSKDTYPTFWKEDFDLANGTTADNGSTAWSSSTSAGSAEVSGGRFEFSNTDPNGGTWTSEVIDISGFSSVDLSVDVKGTGPMERADGLTLSYVLNDGNAVVFFDDHDSFSARTASVEGLSGNTTTHTAVKALRAGRTSNIERPILMTQYRYLQNLFP